MNEIKTLESFKSILANKPLVVALVSDIGCNVCLAITPELETLSKHYHNAHFVMVDTADIPEIIGDQLVFVYPTLIVFADGKETMRFERVFSMLDVEAHIERMTELIFA
ncbi:thioredoxin family protein [Fusibacter paucivorans]|uniref:Thioredoxin family protein n=1 Tax=Fusibacter paucivorans TaxID=76009 RepID=A0ABS5PMW5_9FIRM|nr:thioredoxin family protein [Fusibacter paucivorans]MBS7525739.1 thioredoxin family protein [Fusibacter paucivorans]